MKTLEAEGGQHICLAEGGGGFETWSWTSQLIDWIGLGADSVEFLQTGKTYPFFICVWVNRPDTGGESAEIRSLVCLKAFSKMHYLSREL